MQERIQTAVYDFYVFLKFFFKVPFLLSYPINMVYSVLSLPTFCVLKVFSQIIRFVYPTYFAAYNE